MNSNERASRVGSVPYYGATGQVGWIDDYLFDEELVLIGEDGAPFFDKSKPIAYIVTGKSWVNNHAHVLRARSGVTTNRYLKHYLDNFDFTDYVQGSTRDKLTQAAMNAIPVVVPPLTTQHALVQMIEALADKRTRVSTHAVKARRAVERLRQASLIAACAGRLTEAWRAARRLPQPELPKAHAKPRRLRSIEEFDLEKIPDGWRWVQVDDVLPAGGIFDGPFGSNLKSEDYTSAGARVVRLENVGHLEFIDTKKTYVSMQKYRELGRHAVRPGDVIFSSFVDEKVRVCVLPDQIEPQAIAKADCFTLRADDSVNRSYLAMQLASRRTYEYLASDIHGATRPRVNTTQLRNIPIPICSREEQDEIVRRFRQTTSVSEGVIAQVDRTLALVARSAQAVRSKAFRGEIDLTAGPRHRTNGARSS